ncbi:MAG: TPR end-of-group domain-containing protein [Bacteroidales bacterium]
MAKNYNAIDYEVTPEVLEVKGGEVSFTVKGDVPPKYFNKKAAVLFQPYVQYNGDEYMLKPMILKGENVSGEGTTINYANGGTFTYSATFNYQPKMRVSELMAELVAFAPKDGVAAGMTLEDARRMPRTTTLGDLKLADGIITTSYRIEVGNEVLETIETGDPNINRSEFDVEDQYKVDLLKLAPHGYEKVTVATENATIYYRINQHNFNPSLELNREKNMMEQLEGLDEFLTRGWEIKDIQIDGWASPEGEETFNEGLSERRANTAQNVLVNRFNKLAGFSNANEVINWKLMAHGPDWNGFVQRVKNSDLEDKQQILNVVEYSAPDRREEEIRNMILIYPALLETILPPLRRAEIAVNCYEPKKTDAEIARLATADPDQLEHHEMLYAATLTEDWNTKYNIYKTAAQNNAHSWEAQNNAGYMALKKGKIDEATDYFELAKTLSPNNGVVTNNLGVVYAMQGEYDKAEENFLNANKMGVDNNYNLGLIDLQKGNYESALTKFQGVKCNYNIALAQMMAGNNEAAASNLECARKNAETYYLMAIVGARTGNESMMLTNLEKAVKADPAYKEEAASDREFIMYYDDPDFVAIVD